MHHFLKIIILLLISTQSVSGQAAWKRPFEYIKKVKNSAGGFSALQFRDSISGNTIKTVKLHDLNPYFFKGVKAVDSTYSGRTPVYVLPQNSRHLAGFSIRPPDVVKIKPSDSLYIESVYRVSSPTRGYAVVIITALVTCNTYLVACKSNIYVFNQQGEQVAEISNIPLDLYYPVITENSRFVMCSKGQDYSGEFINSYETHGYIIVDTDKQELIYSADFCCDFIPFVAGGKLFVVSERAEMSEETIKIIDPEARIIYQRKIKLMDGWWMKNVAMDGIYMSNGKEKTFFSYKNDFERLKF